MHAGVFWSAVIFFTLGVGFRSTFSFGVTTELFLIGLGGICVVARYLLRNNHTLLLFGIALCALGLGALRMEMGILERDSALNRYVGGNVRIEGVVIEEPDVRESNTRLSVRGDVLLAGKEKIPIEAGVLVVAPLHASVSYGSRVVAEGALRIPESFETGEGRAFNYPGYLASRGMLYELAFAEVEETGRVFGNPLKRGAILIKQTFLYGLSAVLPEPAAGLAAGITAGDKRGLGPALSDTFRTVGLTHIIVLSGYNIMVVVFALSWVFARFRFSSRVEAVAGIGVAALFALMTGLASSSVRAALMASISILGKATQRTYLALRALAVVALFMLLWNPYLLLFDIGFQLSVIATWGLIALSPLVASYLTRVPEKFGLREIMSATLATQIAVLPMLLYQSGELSVVSLPANILSLVVVPWAMLFSALAGVFGVLLGFIAVPLALPAYALLSYIIFVAETFASLPFASVRVGAFSAWWLLPAYGVLFAFAIARSVSTAEQQSAPPTHAS